VTSLDIQVGPPFQDILVGCGDARDESPSLASHQMAFLDIQVDPPFQDILVGCK